MDDSEDRLADDAGPHGARPAPSGAGMDLGAIAVALRALEDRLIELQTAMREALERVPADRRASAENLVHYVALRQHDLRELQEQLAQHGLSSLGRAESAVLAGVLSASLRAHESLALHGDAEAARELPSIEARRASAMSWQDAKQRLHQHTRDVLGPRPGDRHIAIMVTAPSAAEADRAWMVKMLQAGMNVLRINAAHEGALEWKSLVEALAAARRETGKTCRMLMDLPGPKIRTGPIAGGGHVATWKPERDEIGRPVAAARVVLGRASAPQEGAGALLRVSDEAFARLRGGDVLRFHDARGKKRMLRVDEVTADHALASTMERAYVQDRVEARVHRDGAHAFDLVIEVEHAEGPAIDVETGDALVLSLRASHGRPPLRDAGGRLETPGVVSCTLPPAFEHLGEGQRVLFDDGKICAVVEHGSAKDGAFSLRVTRTQKRIQKLRAQKGINLPDTRVTVPSLAEDDLRALAFVAEHGEVDAVGLSFVRSTDDVRKLHAELDRIGRPHIGVVLKIETAAGFENLPRLLLEGLTRPPLAVMIARGDLAVEVGFERLAELQEEILWLCEASHVPAIWATQVLDTLARTGVPSRAEVTDAAASVAAECVMLNKGPFVGDAVTALANILRRMEKHHYKKRSLFRKLRVSTFTER